MKILFGWEVGAGMGHLSPHRSLLSALQTRGHEIHVVCKDPQKAAAAYSGLNFSIRAAPPLGEKPKVTHRPTVTLAQVLHNGGLHDSEAIFQRAAGWDRVLSSIQPDLILSDYAPTLLVALRGRSIPSALISTGFFVPPNVRPLPPFWLYRQGPPPGVPTTDEELLRVLNQVFARRGVEEIKGLCELFHQGSLSVLKTYPELDHVPGREGAIYMGSPPPENVGAQPVWPSGEGPKVFGYLKTCPGLPRAVAELAALGWPTLIVSDGIPEGVRQRLSSPTLRFTSQRVNLWQVQKQCAVAINNAGHGTTAHFLHAGTPQLLLPLFLEQEMTARTLQRMGAGLPLDPQSGKDAALAVRVLAEVPKYREAALAFSRAHPDYSEKAHLDVALRALGALAPV